MEKHYEYSNILFLESGAHSKSSEICITYLSFMVDQTFSKILNIGRVTVSYLHSYGSCAKDFISAHAQMNAL